LTRSQPDNGSQTERFAVFEPPLTVPHIADEDASNGLGEVL
jgi:hypothetical protein